LLLRPRRERPGDRAAGEELFAVFLVLAIPAAA
jgi:hypothetical protein